MISKIWMWLKALYETELKFTEDTYMSHRDMKTNLARQFKTAYIEITDERKYHVEYGEMQTFLGINMFSYLKYVAQKRDCEDYSAVLNGLFKAFNGQHACGIVFVDTPNGKHALNCFIDIFNKFWYVEPQTNEILHPNDVTYTPYMIVI